MRRNHSGLVALLVTVLGLFAVTPARAASPTKVTADWKGGASGLPSDVSMYIYVPSSAIANPPIVTLIHSCAGSGPGVFSQATGTGTTDGGVVQAADKYGFIMVMPDSGAGRCWDISSKTTQTRDGAADSHAIVQMVKYAISQYKGNANRVYATGCSSGAMMTQLLLALYPDIFKAGSSFAGVPAGCSNAFDSSGLCGFSPAQTAQQWGTRVRDMYQGYAGYRPRVQLVHGDADPTIAYQNMAEAIKEWTNVLNLSSTPTSSTTSGLTLGTHQATRQSWNNSCGYMVLDALTSVGGGHGPPDALFESRYVLPFLGLDSQAAVTAAVDPEITQCGGGGDGGVPPTGDASADASKADSSNGGSGGTSGSGGSVATGGSNAAGGSVATGGNVSTGGSVATGGGNAAGGRVGSGGSVSSGGSPNGTGGKAGSGGSSGSGGAPGTGGSQASGGNPTGTGGAQGSGGAVGTGGKFSAGGSTGSGGTPSTGGAGGNSSSGGNSGSSGSTASGSAAGCGCTLGGATSKNRATMGLVLGLALLLSSRRRRRPVG